MPRLTRVSPHIAKLVHIAEIAGITDIAEFARREWEIACPDWKGCRPGLPGLHRLQILARFPTLTTVPRLPRVSPEMAELVDIANVVCRDFQPRKPRLPGLLRLPKLQTMIATVIDGRDCRSKLPTEPLLGLAILPAKNAQIAGFLESAELADRHSDGDCGPTLPRIPAHEGRLQAEIGTIADRNCWDCRYCRECRIRQDCRDCPVSSEITDIAKIDGSEWGITSGDKQILEIAGQEYREFRDCRIFSTKLQRRLRANTAENTGP